MQTMTPLQTIKRFFEPIFQESGYFYRMVTVHIFYSGYAILSILFVRQITHILEIKNFEILPHYIA